MEIGEWIGTGSVVVILLAIFGMGLVLIQRIDSRYDKLDTEIKAAGTRISDAEREQARQEGENRLLNGRVDFTDTRITDAEREQMRQEIEQRLLNDRVVSMDSRLSESEREQLRQEGANRLLERLAHGHERGGQLSE